MNTRLKETFIFAFIKQAISICRYSGTMIYNNLIEQSFKINKILVFQNVLGISLCSQLAGSKMQEDIIDQSKVNDIEQTQSYK